MPAALSGRSPCGFGSDCALARRRHAVTSDNSEQQGGYSSIGTKYTGAHELEGFLISRGEGDLPVGDTVGVEDLHHLITAALIGPEVMVH